ncbi:MAG TPA: hypothetical protein PLN25_01995 [Deltaproteobacteria bacterium]|nr:hypothetical protein [Deltaproteobacteria bacterium]HQB38830.1 hypothetical protein [Deltaproteobacteria bacterium]
MVDLLLITDIPRLIRLFTQFQDEQGRELRIATDIDSISREITAAKPRSIFIQTHLSGLSADILLMHIKKLLGKRRCRFVLLCDPQQISSEILSLYHGNIDISQDDDSLLVSIIEQMNCSDATPSHFGEQHQAGTDDTTRLQTVSFPPPDANGDDRFEALPGNRPATAPEPAPQIREQSAENSAPGDEPGISYPQRKQLSVYSEFTTTFDSAVNDMNDAKQTDQPEVEWQTQTVAGIGVESAEPSRPGFFRFVRWGIPIIAGIALFTFLQHRSAEIQPTSDKQPADKVVSPPKAAAPQVTAIQPAAPVAPRLDKLPDFIPSDRPDKAYAKSHPGWERYRGNSFDYKVFRQGKQITAIQIIDRSGKGISDTFLQKVLVKLVPAPAYRLESSEMKGGYEIQRGRAAANLQTIHYRDISNQQVRGFVASWQ